jgi:sugar phosphate isomerase/epimerase
MMGDGVIDLARLGRLMGEAGYAGHVEVEIFSEQDWWRRDPAETIAACASWFTRGGG